MTRALCKNMLFVLRFREHANKRANRATKGKKQCNGHPPCELCNTHTEPWCNPREYLEDPLFNTHVGKSVYALQLKRWFSIFGRESFKVRTRCLRRGANQLLIRARCRCCRELHMFWLWEVLIETSRK